MIDYELLINWLNVTRIIRNDSLLNDKFENKITYNEVLVLAAIFNEGHPYSSFGDILKSTKMLKSQLNRTINSLEKKEYIIRKIDEEDKRCQKVKMTNEGESILSEIKETMLKVVRNFIDVIGEEDSKTLCDIFGKIIDKQNLLIKE